MIKEKQNVKLDSMTKTLQMKRSNGNKELSFIPSLLLSIEGDFTIIIFNSIFKKNNTTSSFQGE